MIIYIDENDENKRLDSYLVEITPDLSRSKIQNFIKSGNVKINDTIKKPSYSLKENDKIEFEIPEQEDLTIKPQNIPLDIVYEDENMLVVNKPSGMLTHPTTIERENTLVNALLYKYGENLSDINGEFRRGILHRLDRNTSGLLMIAKNNNVHEFLANQIKEHTLTKKYRAIVKGVIKEDELEINLPIGRNPNQPHKMMVREDGKESLTRVKVLERFKEHTYVELTLITGRTHQIRVHMSHIKHPVYNDTLYGAGHGKVKTEEQVLQSYYLSFTKPFGNEIINLEIEPDEKINKVLRTLSCWIIIDFETSSEWRNGGQSERINMQILSIISALIAAYLVLMNYHNIVTINLLNEKFAALTNLSIHTLQFDFAIYTIIVFFLGIFSVIFFFAPLYASLKTKFTAYKRELEKGSISNSNGEAKIKVLENKITVLEKALDDALKNR